MYQKGNFNFLSTSIFFDEIQHQNYICLSTPQHFINNTEQFNEDFRLPSRVRRVGSEFKILFTLHITEMNAYINDKMQSIFFLYSCNLPRNEPYLKFLKTEFIITHLNQNMLFKLEVITESELQFRVIYVTANAMRFIIQRDPPFICDLENYLKFRKRTTCDQSDEYTPDSFFRQTPRKDSTILFPREFKGDLLQHEALRNNNNLYEIFQEMKNMKRAIHQVHK